MESEKLIGRKVYLLNTLIVPINFDKHPNVEVKLTRITLEEAKQILQHNSFVSAIGHEATAKLLTQLLNLNVPASRISVYFEPGDIGIHLFLKTRIPEGKILSEAELKNLDFWLVKSQVL